MEVSQNQEPLYRPKIAGLITMYGSRHINISAEPEGDGSHPGRQVEATIEFLYRTLCPSSVWSWYAFILTTAHHTGFILHRPRANAVSPA